MNNMTREELQYQLADAIVMGLDRETLEQIAFNGLMERYDDMTEEELLEEVRDRMPELLTGDQE